MRDANGARPVAHGPDHVNPHVLRRKVHPHMVPSRRPSTRKCGCKTVRDGTILAVLLLIPVDPLHPHRPDEHVAPEAQAARDIGVEVALIDHDAAHQCGAEAAVRFLSTPNTDAVYRGWMLRSERYAPLAAAAKRRRVVLRTSAAAYEAAHELPGWYQAFQSFTPPSAWLTSPGTDGLRRVLDVLPDGPAVIKDYVKSMKHYWSEAAYIPDVRDLDGARRVADRFLELRGDELVGGIVVRSFVEFQPGEARTWWVDGRCVLVTAHPDTPGLVPDSVPTTQFAAAVKVLGSPFVTPDLAMTTTGQWLVVEVGDGQVSDRPESTPPGDLVRALNPA
jgi:ATP-grasp domain, R2K clade family 3